MMFVRLINSLRGLFVPLFLSAYVRLRMLSLGAASSPNQIGKIRVVYAPEDLLLDNVKSFTESGACIHCALGRVLSSPIFSLSFI